MKDSLQSLARDLRRYLEQLEEEGMEYLVAPRVSPGRTPKRTERAVPAPSAPVRRPEARKDSQPPPAPAGRASSLSSLVEKIRGCRRCQLAKGRSNSVPGEGGFRRGVMLIGEGPGENEDLQGRPFVGRAGKLLDKMLASIGLGREDVYITNIVKCRPPQNRDPKPDEIIACWPLLERQIEILKPRLIVALGSPAAKTLLDTDTAISRLRGKLHDCQGIPLLATFHPAYLLRSYTVENRTRAWEDMKALKKYIEKK